MRMRHSGSGIVAAALATFLAGCAQVPVVDEADLVKASAGSQIRVYGARGPLSAKQSKAVLSRLAEQAPDAGALERHLRSEERRVGKECLE